jgi:hypothetical protein
MTTAKSQAMKRSESTAGDDSAARIGDDCPIYGCTAKVVGQVGVGHSASVICEKGHHLVDKDGPISHGTQQSPPRQREPG